MKKIGICGFGYVGKAMVRMLATHYSIKIFDPSYRNLDVEWHAQYKEVELVNNLEDLKSCKMIVICVPTPSCEDGRCDITIVEKTLCELKKIQFGNVVMIKSTVEPGTTERLAKQYDLKVIFSPEFAGESTYWSPYAFDTDMKAMPYVILGGKKELTSEVIDILLPILGPKKTYAQTDSTTAELVKYWENVFFATKVTFMNEMYEICKVLGVDYNETRELWSLDPRVEKMHTAVFKDKRGYAGKCLIAGSKLELEDGSLLDVSDAEVGDKIYDGSGYTMIKKKGYRQVDNTVKINVGGREITGSLDHLQPIFSDGEPEKLKELFEVMINDNILIPYPILYPISSVDMGKKPKKQIKWWLDNIKIDKAWARLIGLYLAEGCSYADEYSIIWSVGEKEEKLANEIVKLLKGKGLNPFKRLQITPGATFGESRCWIVRVRGIGLYSFFNRLGLGSCAKTKNMPVFNDELNKIMIGGYLEGDGCYSNGTIEVSSSSNELINKLDKILLSLDICANIDRMKSGHFRLRISTKDEIKEVCKWVKRFKFNSNRYKNNNSYASPTKSKIKGGFLVRVKSVEIMPGDTVYSLETESGYYVANGILTHNCFPKDTKALKAISEFAGYKPKLISQVIECNEEFLKMNKKSE